MSERHTWSAKQTRGVPAGSGRPHGVIEEWTCRRCGARKQRAPRSTNTGARVIRWTYYDPDGLDVDRLGPCRGWRSDD